MKFSDLEISNDVVKAMDIKDVRTAKKEAVQDFKANKKSAFGFGGLTLLMAAAAFITKKEVPIAVALIGTGITTIAVVDSRKKFAEAKQLDVIHYLKSGNVEDVLYADSVYKAKKSGFSIG